MSAAGEDHSVEEKEWCGVDDSGEAYYTNRVIELPFRADSTLASSDDSDPQKVSLPNHIFRINCHDLPLYFGECGSPNRYAGLAITISHLGQYVKYGFEGLKKLQEKKEVVDNTLKKGGLPDARKAKLEKKQKELENAEK